MTIVPSVHGRLFAADRPDAVAWHRDVAGDDGRVVVVRGLYARSDSDTLVIVVHGLGGSPDSPYLAPIARAARERGWSSLRLALRGTEGVGNDFYHGGLTADLEAVLSDPRLQHYDRIFVVGFSLGGHIALRYGAASAPDERLHGVAAVCPPIDLGAGCAAIDAPRNYVYREYILTELRTMYRQLVDVGVAVPTAWSRVKMAKTIREWDALTVVPRFGFGSVDSYYGTQSIAHRMGDFRVPSLMVHSPNDPMIPPDTVLPALPSANELFEAQWHPEGGHCFFPRELDLGQSGATGLGPQVLSWLDSRAR